MPTTPENWIENCLNIGYNRLPPEVVRVFFPLILARRADGRPHVTHSCSTAVEAKNTTTTWSHNVLTALKKKMRLRENHFACLLPNGMLTTSYEIEIFA